MVDVIADGPAFGVGLDALPDFKDAGRRSLLLERRRAFVRPGRSLADRNACGQFCDSLPRGGQAASGASWPMPSFRIL